LSRESSIKTRAPQNRTITLGEGEQDRLEKKLLSVESPRCVEDVINRTIHGDTFKVLDLLPDAFIDLVFADPPYNMNKNFNTTKFRETESHLYEEWLDGWLFKMVRLLKKNASVYICGDWRSSGAVMNAAGKYFHIRNRITFEREKGRGAKSNWKNCSEDIWFCTLSDEYCFNVDAVKMKKRVVAPYKDIEGRPKDWDESPDGNFRITHPSNIWTDITIPFWSMRENTDHPTQKSEKLVAKIILASSKPGDVVFDPFLGSGTTFVTAKKLGRKYCGIELDRHYCCLAEKRLELAETDRRIQGCEDGVFWERNSR